MHVLFCSVTLSASCCTAIQGSPSITFFQYCDFLQQHTDILNEIQLSHIFHHDFLFSYYLPISFLFFLTPHLFQSQTLGLPSLFLCMLSIYPPLLSSLSCSCNLFSPVSYTPCLFLFLPFLRESSVS